MSTHAQNLAGVEESDALRQALRWSEGGVAKALGDSPSVLPSTASGASRLNGWSSPKRRCANPAPQ